MLAAAAIVSGALVGFLFGIPRTQTAERSAGDRGTADEAWAYQPNTNLEEISDWLTKILVGIGLVQIGQLRRSFRDLVHSVAPGLGNDQTARAFATALLIYFLVAGFLTGYLITRLRLAGAFAYADRAALGRFVERVAKQTVDEQAARDVRALGLVTRQLETGDAAQDELNDAIRQASGPAKVQTFLQARSVRQESRRQKDSERLPRVIPVFRALSVRIRGRNFTVTSPTLAMRSRTGSPPIGARPRRH